MCQPVRSWPLKRGVNPSGTYGFGGSIGCGGAGGCGAAAGACWGAVPAIDPVRSVTAASESVSVLSMAHLKKVDRSTLNCSHNQRAMTPSYVSGPSTVPLLGETIGACVDRIGSAFPERDALVSCHQNIRLTYRELAREV